MGRMALSAVSAMKSRLSGSLPLSPVGWVGVVTDHRVGLGVATDQSAVLPPLV